MEQIILNNQPESNGMWRGIGGHFDALGQIMAEFVDNAVSNFKRYDPVMRQIYIRLHEASADRVFVSVEDTGSGIENLENAFRLGGTESPDTPLNEHGFGMKHALASANPFNDDWRVYTRTEGQFEAGKHTKVTAEFLINGLAAGVSSIDEERWPGLHNGSGTYIAFTCSREMFETLRRGVQGPSGFSRCVEYLAEDLGFVYAGLISSGEVAIRIVEKDISGNERNHNVAAVQPDWRGYYSPGNGQENVDLGYGVVQVKYQFGEMNASSYYKYYKRNMSSSGLEIRVNGRLLEKNLFKSVWEIEPHNRYNHLLVIVDLRSTHSERLPVTRTSKNGFRQGDEKFISLIEWVRRKMPDPPRDLSNAYNEHDLFVELLDMKQLHVPDPKTVKREQKVFQTIQEQIAIDLYLHHGSDLILYEGKKDKTSVKDVYQLKMYWDGCVLDGMTPTQGILISAEHPQSVEQLIAHINQMHDLRGNTYSFLTKTWRDEGVSYP